MKRSRKTSELGFTLIELMIVVVIIGILSAIAVPNFLAMQDRAREASVKSIMHTIQTCFEDFAAQADGLYPTAAADVTLLGDTLTDLMPGADYPVNPFTAAPTPFAWGAAAGATKGACAATTATVSQYVLQGRGNDPASYLPFTLRNF
jgi:prepilin-type N-terminal cleavage/methylation domain-containing protein